MALVDPAARLPPPGAAAARPAWRGDGWLAAWLRRPRGVQTALAPALPALVLLALTVAATADPPAAGPLTLTAVHAVHDRAHPGPAYPVTPR